MSVRARMVKRIELLSNRQETSGGCLVAHCQGGASLQKESVFLENLPPQRFLLGKPAREGGEHKKDSDLNKTQRRAVYRQFIGAKNSLEKQVKKTFGKPQQVGTEGGAQLYSCLGVFQGEGSDAKKEERGDQNPMKSAGGPKVEPCGGARLKRQVAQETESPIAHTMHPSLVCTTVRR